MPRYKVTYFFNSKVNGWTESYYCEQPNDIAACAAARKLAVQRIQLCGTQVDLAKIRVSDQAIRGDSISDGGGGYTTGTSVTSPEFTISKSYPAGERVDVAWNALLVTISKDNVGLGRVFMRGIADSQFVGSRAFIPAIDWKRQWARFSQLYANPLEGWGLLRKPKSTAANTFKIISALSLNGTDIAIKMDAGFACAVGTMVCIRGLKSDQGTLSATLRCTSSTTPIFGFAKQFNNPQPNFLPNTGTAQVATPTFVTGLDMTYDLPTSRRSGRPFGAQVGRRSKGLQLR